MTPLSQAVQSQFLRSTAVSAPSAAVAGAVHTKVLAESNAWNSLSKVTL